MLKRVLAFAFLSLLLLSVAAKAAVSDAAVRGPKPKAVAPAMVHYFGRMEPNQVATHRFALRNEGDAPLEIQQPAGSCKCLVTEVNPSVIPAGGSGELLVRWRAGEASGEPFRQLVVVPTNDPDSPLMEFVVSGDVGGHLLMLPARIEWKNARHRKSKSAKIEVLSRHWEALDIEVAKVTHPNLKVSVEDVTPNQRLRDRVKSGKQLTVEASAEMCVANFTAFIDLRVWNKESSDSPVSDVPADAAPGDDDSVSLQIPVSFSLGSPLSIIGPGYDSDEKRAYLGVQQRGQALTRRYTIKVRDEEKRLALTDTRVIPDFVQTKFDEYDVSRGLYRLELTLPPYSLKRGYIGKTAGSLTLEFDHPRIRELKMSLEMSPSH